MPKPSRRLSRADIIRALTRLGELCAKQQSRVEIALYGGTVMMLALKCRAGRLPTPFRAGDLADIKFLLRELSIRSMAEVDRIAAEYYGTGALEPRKRWLVEKLLQEVRHG